MMYPGQTEAWKQNRLDQLEKILAQADQEDIELSKVEIQKKLADNGFIVSLVTVYSDCNELARNNTFIQRLATNNYSSIMETCFKRYEKIFKKAMAISDNETNLIREINTNSSKDDTHSIIKDKADSIKLQALTVAKNAQDSIRLMVNGENLHKSAHKWIETTRQQEAKIKQLQEELNKIKSGPTITPISEDTQSNNI